MKEKKELIIYQLIKEFNLSFEYCYLNNITPDISNIENLLEDNKDKPGYLYVLLEFLFF